jgi:hypothetical protein
MNKLTSQLFIQLYKAPETALNLDLGQWNSLIFILRHHQLLARYQFIFQRAGIFERLPEYAKHHLTNAKILSHKQRQQVFHEAKSIIGAFGFNSKHKIFLKGAAYTLSEQTAGVGRIYSDIDILVDKQNLDEIEKSLVVSGWLTEQITKYDDNYYRNWSHEIPPLRHGGRGTVLDIHHNIIPIISGRAPNVSYLFEQVEITRDGFSVLSPSAMTLHSLVHLFFNDDVKNGFRDLLDLDLLIKNNCSDYYWTNLIQLAKDTDFNMELKLAIRYLTKILQTPIPENVLQELKLPSSPAIKIIDFIYLRVLLPSHPLVNNRMYNLANFMAMCRGHWLKMPMHILIYHFSLKGIRSAIEYFLGKTFFLQDDTNHKKF